MLFQTSQQLRNVAIISTIVILIGLVQGCNAIKDNTEVYEKKMTPLPSLSAPTSTNSPETILNKKMKDFLNKEGDYSEGSIINSIYDTGLVDGTVEMKLGIVSDVWDQVNVEGIVFTYIDIEGSIVVIVGFDGKDSKRFITGLEIPIYLLNKYPTSDFYVQTLPDDSTTIVVEDESGDEKTIRKYLSRFVVGGKPVVFNLDLVGLPEEWKNKNEYMKELVPKSRSKFKYARKLAVDIWPNSGDISKIGDIPDDTRIVSIRTVDDINDIDLSQIPMINVGITYNGQ